MSTIVSVIPDVQQSTKTSKNKQGKRGTYETKDPRLQDENLDLDHSTGRYVCRKCGKSFKLLVYYKRHVCRSDATVLEKTFCCDHCGKLFPSLWCLKQHLGQHDLPVERPMCHSCGKRYKDEINLKRHIRSKHTHPAAIQHHCVMCGLNTVNFKYLKDHLRRHLRIVQYPCPLCGKSFQWKNVLKDHMKTVHYNIRAYACEICGKQFKQRIALKNHFKVVHVEERPFACPDCPKKFVLVQHLREHMDSHQRQKGPKKEYICHICNNRPFLDKTCLMVHVASAHSDEKPFVCDVCGKSFKLKNGLRAHIQTHSEERAFQCEVCNKAFKMKKDLKKHQERHKTSKDYFCKVCGKEFVHKNDVYRHQLVHDPTRHHRIYKPGEYEVTNGQLVRNRLNKLALRESVSVNVTDFDSKANSGFCQDNTPETEKNDVNSNIMMLSPSPSPGNKVVPTLTLFNVAESRENNADFNNLESSSVSCSSLTLPGLECNESWKFGRFCLPDACDAWLNVSCPQSAVPTLDCLYATSNHTGATSEHNSSPVCSEEGPVGLAEFNFEATRNSNLNVLDDFQSDLPSLYTCSRISDPLTLGKAETVNFEKASKYNNGGTLNQECDFKRGKSLAASLNSGSEVMNDQSSLLFASIGTVESPASHSSSVKSSNMTGLAGADDFCVTLDSDDRNKDMACVGDCEGFGTDSSFGGHGVCQHTFDLLDDDRYSNRASAFNRNVLASKPLNLMESFEEILARDQPVFPVGSIDKAAALLLDEDVHGTGDSKSSRKAAVRGVNDGESNFLNGDDFATSHVLGNNKMFAKTVRNLLGENEFDSSASFEGSVVVQQVLNLIESAECASESTFSSSDVVDQGSNHVDIGLGFGSNKEVTEQDVSGRGEDIGVILGGSSVAEHNEGLEDYDMTTSFGTDEVAAFGHLSKMEGFSFASNVNNDKVVLANDQASAVSRNSIRKNTFDSAEIGSSCGTLSPLSLSEMVDGEADEDSGTFCGSNVDLQSLDEYLNEELNNDHSLSDLHISHLNASDFEESLTSVSPITVSGSAYCLKDSVDAKSDAYGKLHDVLQVSDIGSRNMTLGFSGALATEVGYSSRSEDDIDFQSEDLLSFGNVSTPKYDDVAFLNIASMPRSDVQNNDFELLANSRGSSCDSFSSDTPTPQCGHPQLRESDFLLRVSPEMPSLQLRNETSRCIPQPGESDLLSHVDPEIHCLQLERERGFGTPGLEEESRFLTGVNPEIPSLQSEKGDNTTTPKIGKSGFLNTVIPALQHERERSMALAKFGELDFLSDVISQTPHLQFEDENKITTPQFGESDSGMPSLDLDLLRYGSEDSPCTKGNPKINTKQNGRKKEKLPLIDFQMTSCDMFNDTCDIFEGNDSQEVDSVISSGNDSHNVMLFPVSSTEQDSDDSSKNLTEEENQAVQDKMKDDTVGGRLKQDICVLLPQQRNTRCKVMEIVSGDTELAHGIIRHRGQRSLADKGELQCRWCKVRFKSRGSLRHHNSTCKADHLLESGKKFTCEKCGKCFTTRSNLNLHHATIHTNNHKKFVCHLCGYECNGAQNLRRHIVCHSSARPFKCDLCQKAFKTREAIRGHLMIHLPSKILYRCEQCEKCFNHCASLQAHKLTHLPTPPALACDFCSKTFSDKSNLMAHKKRHLRTNKVTCHVCTKQLSSVKSLQVHKGSACAKYLSKKKKLEMKKENLQAKLAKKQAEEKKKQTRHAEREQKNEDRLKRSFCSICRQQFDAVWQLTNHMVKHSSEKMFLCDICGKAFKRMTSVNFHKKLSHLRQEVRSF